MVAESAQVATTMAASGAAALAHSASRVASLSAPWGPGSRNTTETVGAFVQDRQAGILGAMGQDPKMIPVTVSLHNGTAIKVFHYEVLNNAKLSPLAMMATVFNALHGINDYGEDVTYRMSGSLSVKGYTDVTMRNMFAPSDSGQPAAALAAASIGDRFGRIYSNP